MKNPSPAPQNPVPWWQVGPMWLVVGGPLTVVVAAIGTAFIAAHGADPVLDRHADDAVNVRAHQLENTPVHLQPAQQARNHAASPVQPRQEP